MLFRSRREGSNGRMNEKIKKLFRFIKELMDSKKSVQVRLNFHEGDLSEKVEVKESVKLE